MQLVRLLLSLPLLLCACGTEPSARVESGDLVGTWNWVSTGGGLTGQISSTPATSGRTVQLELRADDSYTITESGTEFASDSYTVTLQESIYSVTEERYLNCLYAALVEGVVTNGVIQFNTLDSLSISDNLYDGFASTFVRR